MTTCKQWAEAGAGAKKALCYSAAADDVADDDAQPAHPATQRVVPDVGGILSRHYPVVRGGLDVPDHQDHR